LISGLACIDAAQGRIREISLLGIEAITEVNEMSAEGGGKVGYPQVRSV
jgi:hypothetical protein